MELTEIKLKILEIAERSAHTPYVASVGGADSYRDKDYRAILNVADKMLNWVMEPGVPDTQTNLIEKLRSALCDRG